MSHLHLNELSLICDMWWNKITYLLVSSIFFRLNKIKRRILLRFYLRTFCSFDKKTTFLVSKGLYHFILQSLIFSLVQFQQITSNPRRGYKSAILLQRFATTQILIALFRWLVSLLLLMFPLILVLSRMLPNVSFVSRLLRGITELWIVTSAISGATLMWSSQADGF